MSAELVDVVQRYLKALDRSDLDYLRRLFSSTGRVFSPYLGELPVNDFFDKLARASTGAKITTVDILQSTTGARRVLGYFRYEWFVRDGSIIDFMCVDVFDFEDTEPLIRKMTIVCDTHPVRITHGNKYEL